MTGTIVEPVARAICQAMGYDPEAADRDTLPENESIDGWKNWFGFKPEALAAILAMDRRASPPAPAVAKVFGWARGVHQPSTPHGPAEYDIDFVYGDDQPSGDGWFAVYREPAPAVAVKPLDWVIQPYYWEAMTPFGRYGAWESESNPSLSYWKAPEDVARREVNGDLAAAKADAQKHFDKLVSALVEPAPAVTVPEGWRQLRENLDRVTDHLSTWVADHADEATTETHAALYCARDILARTAAAAPQPPATRSYEEGKRDGRQEVIEAAATLAEDIGGTQAAGWDKNPMVEGCGGAIAASNTGHHIATAIRSLADEPHHG